MSNKRGRPPKTEIAYDPEAIKEFINRLFSIEKEIKVLQEDKKELTDEFKDKIKIGLVKKIIRLVKLEVSMSEDKSSEQTIEEIQSIVKDKINMIVG